MGRLAFLTDYPDDLQPPDPVSGAAHPPSWGGGARRHRLGLRPQPHRLPALGRGATPDPEGTYTRRRELLTQLLEGAKRRGWSIYLFEPPRGRGARRPPSSPGRVGP